FFGAELAWADAEGAIASNELSFCAYAERAGCLKQTAVLARERLQQVFPDLRAMGAHAAEQKQNEANAMKDSWRRRKKKPDAENAGLKDETKRPNLPQFDNTISPGVNSGVEK